MKDRWTKAQANEHQQVQQTIDVVLCPVHTATPDTTEQSCLGRVWRAGVKKL